MRRDIEHKNPYKYLSNTPDGVQASASQPPDPTEKLLLIQFSRCGVLCLCIHWVGGAEHKTTSFPNPCR